MNNINTQNALIDEFRNDLCSLIKERGITQLEVVKATNISQSQLSFFINGKRGLGGDAVLKLIKFTEQLKSKDSPPPTPTTAKLSLSERKRSRYV